MESSDTVHALDQIARLKFMGIIADWLCNERHLLNEGDKFIADFAFGVASVSVCTALAWIARQRRSGVALLTQQEHARGMWHICLTWRSSRSTRDLPHSGRIPALMLSAS
jgi:hypothetical protein